MKNFFVALFIVFGMLIGFEAPSYADDDTVIYLVRHSEKLSGSDPALSELGIARTAALAGRLKEAGIAHVFSSDFKRTRMTATPVAEQSNVDVTIYNVRALRQFVTELEAFAKPAKGNILVVGHSNTTPVVASFLTKTEFPMLNEDQYDHLYVVRQNEEGSFSATIEYFNP